MNNSSLTEMAAKAIGNAPEGFSPLTDDGDCARMEAKLGLSILWFKDYVLSGKGRLQQVIDCKDHNGDKNAARRAASVAIAVEIWRLM